MHDLRLGQPQPSAAATRVPGWAWSGPWPWPRPSCGPIRSTCSASRNSARAHSGIARCWRIPVGRRISNVQIAACGNGGSAAEAQHLTGELVGRFRSERRPLSAIALHTDTSAGTAIVNDYGETELFARQVRAHGRSDDVLVLLSTSGASPNVLAAAKAAHDIGVTTWAMTGPAPNPLAALCDDRGGRGGTHHRSCAVTPASGMARGRPDTRPGHRQALALPADSARRLKLAPPDGAAAPKATARPVRAVAQVLRTARRGDAVRAASCRRTAFSP